MISSSAYTHVYIYISKLLNVKMKSHVLKRFHERLDESFKVQMTFFLRLRNKLFKLLTEDHLIATVVNKLGQHTSARLIMWTVKNRK